MTELNWSLHCSACGRQESGTALVGVCPDCGQPFLVDLLETPPTHSALRPRWDMWRYSAWLPLGEDEEPVTSVPVDE